MSDQLEQAIKEFWEASNEADLKATKYNPGYILHEIAALDNKDPLNNDPWNLWDDDLTEVIDSLGKPKTVKPWIDFANWMPKERKCDCGGEKANTTHSHWCSTRKL